MNFAFRQHAQEEPERSTAPDPPPPPAANPVPGATCAGCPDGSPCGAKALSGRQHCRWHDPEAIAAREATNGRARTRRTDPGPPVRGERRALKTAADVADLLEELADYLATHPEADPRRVTGLNAVANSLLRALDAKQLEEQLTAALKRMAALEEQLDTLAREENRQADCVSSMERINADLHKRCEVYARELKYVGIDAASLVVW